MNLDEKDCKILEILQKDCRTSLTDIAKEIGLSIDSTKKRIKKMENDVFFPRIQIRPRKLGFPNMVDINIKLKNHSKVEINKFVKYLVENPRVSEVFAVSGEWNLSFILLTKDAEDLEKITSEIKSKFGNIISAWNESTTLEVFKFEKYDLNKLLEIKKQMK